MSLLAKCNLMMMSLSGHTWLHQPSCQCHPQHPVAL